MAASGNAALGKSSATEPPIVVVVSQRPETSSQMLLRSTRYCHYRRLIVAMVRVRVRGQQRGWWWWVEEARQTCPRRGRDHSGCEGGGGGTSVLPLPYRAPRFCGTPIQILHRPRPRPRDWNHRDDPGPLLNASGRFLRRPRHHLRESHGICRVGRLVLYRVAACQSRRR